VRSFAFHAFSFRSSTDLRKPIPWGLLKIHHDISTFQSVQRPVITIGTFDGVHSGHEMIIQRVRELARRVDGESVLLTFHPHPRLVLFQEIGLELLTTMDEKIQLLEAAGLDHLIIHPFTKEFARRSAVSYVRDLLVNDLNVHTVVVGYDHHFGRNREGGIEELKEFSELYGFDIQEISAQTIDDVEVSSTKIRRAMLRGEVEVANEYLGHRFSLHGEVVQGEQNGRKIGFPTANIRVVDQYKIRPARGVYAVEVKLEDVRYEGMLNIGIRPTLEDNLMENRFEVHLFDFERDIYGANLVVEFVQRIRDEQKFGSMEELRGQLERDKLAVQQVFND